MSARTPITFPFSFTTTCTLLKAIEPQTRTLLTKSESELRAKFERPRHDKTSFGEMRVVRVYMRVKRETGMTGEGEESLELLLSARLGALLGDAHEEGHDEAVEPAQALRERKGASIALHEARARRRLT